MRLTTERAARTAPETAATWLRWARERRGWSKRECARRLGVTEPTLLAWERRGAPAYAGLAMAALAAEVGAWSA